MSPPGDSAQAGEGAPAGANPWLAPLFALLGSLTEVAQAVTGDEIAARWLIRAAVAVIVLGAIRHALRGRLARWRPRFGGRLATATASTRRLGSAVWPWLRMLAIGIAAGGAVLALWVLASAGWRLLQAHLEQCPMPREIIVSVPSYDVARFEDLTDAFTRARATGRCADTRMKVVASPPIAGLAAALRNGWRTPDGQRLIGPRPDLLVVESRDIANMLDVATGNGLVEDAGQIAYTEIVVGVTEPLRNQVERATRGADLESVLRFFAEDDRNFVRPDPLISGAGLLATVGLESHRVFPNLESAEDRMRNLPEEMGDAFWNDQANPVSLLCNLQRDYDSRRNKLLRRSAFLAPRHLIEDYNRRTARFCADGDRGDGRLWIPEIPPLAILDYHAIRLAWPDRDSPERVTVVHDLADWLRTQDVLPGSEPRRQAAKARPTGAAGELARAIETIREREQRLDVAVVLDGSGSMQRHLPVAVRSVKEIVDALRPTDQVSVDIARRPSRQGPPQVYPAYPLDTVGAQGEQVVQYLGQWTPRDWDLDVAETIARMRNRTMHVLVIVTDTSMGKQADLRRITAEVIGNATEIPSGAPVYIVNTGDDDCPPALRPDAGLGDSGAFCVDAADLDVTTALDRLREPS
ncbi:vWA domain-containing protein [Herbidospora cretacea]|uniref:vWA domain-containing protein n=1 Tax=Herbidospora cretacea TaxID=28444 RepID=UPI0012DCEEE9|nr:vWA domain-containing protein [Herbidospora cretacea]